MEFGEPALEVAIYRESPGELDEEYEARLKREVLRLEPRLAGSDINDWYTASAEIPLSTLLMNPLHYGNWEHTKTKQG